MPLVAAAGVFSFPLVKSICSGGLLGFLLPALVRAASTSTCSGEDSARPLRAAGLAPGAEPRIVDESLRLLEQLAGKPRRGVTTSEGELAKTVLGMRPAAFWRMNEFNGLDAEDSSGRNRTAVYEDRAAFYLEGPGSRGVTGGETNRAPRLAGGRMKANVAGLRPNYSISLWFWNGLPNNARAVSGHLFSRGPDGDTQAPGDHLGIGGTREGREGRLIFYNGNKLGTVLAGNTVIAPKTWNHAVLAREGDNATMESLSAQLRKASTNFAGARRVATDPGQATPKRAAATALLGRDEAERKGDLARLISLLDPATPGETQIAAAKALAANGTDETPEAVTKEWAAQGPAAHSAILDAWPARKKWTLDLLAQVASKRLPALEIDARHRERVSNSRTGNGPESPRRRGLDPLPELPAGRRARRISDAATGIAALGFRI
jgi:hypothetical protein